MKRTLILAMGILNLFGVSGNAREQTQEQGNTSEIQLSSTKEGVRQQQTLRYRPIYEAELKALATTDTLYLVDRKYVNSGYCTWDTIQMIGLMAEEKRIIIDAYTRGTFEPIDFNIYDKDGNLGFISGTGIVAHGEPSPPPNYYAYLFVVKDKKNPLPYNYGCFRIYDLCYTVGISGYWREKVDAIIQKYCSDSFSKNETYWQNMPESGIN